MRWPWFFVLLALIVTDAGCGSRNPVLADGASLDGAQPDQPRPDSWLRDTWAADGRRWDISSTPAVDFVVSRWIMPDMATVAQYGWDYNNDGTPDNALASILGALSGMTQLDLQGQTDAVVYSGSALQLMRLHAATLVNDPAAVLHTWVGAPQACCQTPSNVNLCGAQAAATCFNGSHAFSPDPADPQGTLLQGTIVGGKAHFSAPKMKVRLFVGIAGPVLFELKAPHLKGSVSSTGIANGVLAGAIEKAELQNMLIPAMAALLNQVLQDPTTSQPVKDTILTLFDANQDGVITVAEVMNNAIIKTFLDGDVDVDNDGMNELSMGLGFKAVRAVITP